MTKQLHIRISKLYARTKNKLEALKKIYKLQI